MLIMLSLQHIKIHDISNIQTFISSSFFYLGMRYKIIRIANVLTNNPLPCIIYSTISESNYSEEVKEPFLLASY